MTEPRRRTWRRAGIGATALTALLAAGLPLAGSATAAAGPERLGKADRALLAEATVNGRGTVKVLVAAVPGQTAQAVKDLQALGATTGYRENSLDYIRATIAVDKVGAASRSAAIAALDVDSTIVLDDPAPQGYQDPTPQPPPGAGTPVVNPYMPINETGAAKFVKQHPTWDGRDVTIGIVDAGIDLNHPALQTTTTGETKVVDWVAGTDPLSDNDPSWVRMDTQVSGKTFTVGGVTYTAPANRSYRFGVLDERDPRLDGEDIEGDLNKDGNPPGSSGLFGVLWDVQAQRVAVDTDQDHSFADELVMQRYSVNHDVGEFGTDDPSTPVREQVPFVVQPDKATNTVNIGFIAGSHGTHVAGIAAANGLFGGAMTGAAPGAKLVSVRACLYDAEGAGCTAHALFEGMIYAVRNAGVDVINMSIGGLPALNDANNARAELYNRLIDRFGVQMFISAGNSGPGVNTIGDPSVASKVMSVGAYVSRQTWRSNYGSDSNYKDNLFPFSSRGPREDGGFKPDIVAPGSAVSSTATFSPGGPVTGTYDLPPGYSMFNGTSMASPQSAGAAALLISAGKATSTQHRAGPAARGDQVQRPLPRPVHRRRAGQRPVRRARRLVAAPAGPHAGHDRRQRPGQLAAVAASWRRPASASASTTARACSRVTPSPAPTR